MFRLLALAVWMNSVLYHLLTPFICVYPLKSDGIPDLMYFTIKESGDILAILFERSEFLIPTWVTPQYRATSKKIYMYVCSTNLGFSGEKICACVRLILV